MHPEPDTFGSGAVKGAGAAAAAAAGTDWTQLSEELRAIDAQWSESKGGRASEWWGCWCGGRVWQRSSGGNEWSLGVCVSHQACCL